MRRITKSEAQGVELCVCNDYRRDHLSHVGACGFHDGCKEFTYPDWESVNCNAPYREHGIVHACGHLRDHDGAHGHRTDEENSNPD